MFGPCQLFSLAISRAKLYFCPLKLCFENFSEYNNTIFSEKTGVLILILLNLLNSSFKVLTLTKLGLILIERGKITGIDAVEKLFFCINPVLKNCHFGLSLLFGNDAINDWNPKILGCRLI